MQYFHRYLFVVAPQGSKSKEQVIWPYTSRLLAVLPNAMCPYLPGDRCRTGYYGLRTPICFYTEKGEQVTYDPAFIQPGTCHSRDSTRPSPTTPSPPAVKPTTAASKSFVGSLASNDSRGSGSVNSSGGNWPTITQTQPQFWPNRGGQNGRRGNGDDNGRGRGSMTWRGRGAVRQNQQPTQVQTASTQ